jgi:hypothetical protein
MLRTADVGSYNLGEGHERTYQVMLNSMNADRKLYIDKYVISKMIDYNFGPNAKRATIKFRKLGQTDTALLKELLLALINLNKINIDIEELGQATGMTIEEVKETLAEPPRPGEGDPADPDADPASPDTPTDRVPRREARAVAKEITDRVRGQVEAAFRKGAFEGEINMGFKRKMEKAFAADGYAQSPIAAANELYGRMDHWLADVTTSLPPSEWLGPEEFMDLFGNVLRNELSNASGS